MRCFSKKMALDKVQDFLIVWVTFIQNVYYIDTRLCILQVCQFEFNYLLNFICHVIKFHSHHFTIFCTPLVCIKRIKNQTNLQNFVCQCALALPFVLRLRGQWTRLSYWWWIIKQLPTYLKYPMCISVTCRAVNTNSLG